MKNAVSFENEALRLDERAGSRKKNEGSATRRPGTLGRTVVRLESIVFLLESIVFLLDSTVVHTKQEVVPRNTKVVHAKFKAVSLEATEVHLATPKGTHRSLATLKLPKAVPALITYAQGILKGITSNPNLPSPVPTAPEIAQALSDLQNGETAALTRVKGAVANRNEKRTTLVSLLQQLRGYVQVTADANPENGASIIESAGLAVRKSVTRAPRVFSVKPGSVSGEVKVIAPSAGHRSSYEWEYSIDGGATWLTMQPTIQAKTSLVGLKPGSSVMFRYRWVAKSGVSDWSQPVTMPVVK